MLTQGSRLFYGLKSNYETEKTYRAIINTSEEIVIARSQFFVLIFHFLLKKTKERAGCFVKAFNKVLVVNTIRENLVSRYTLCESNHRSI